MNKDKMIGRLCRNGFLCGCCSDNTKTKTKRRLKRAERRAWKMEAQAA